MDNTPLKRRRTSFTTFTSVGHNRNDSPGIHHTPKRASSHDGIRTPTRALFISPTKASLARFNPHLLPPSPSAQRKLLNLSGRIIQRNGGGQPPQVNGERGSVTRTAIAAVIEEERSVADAGESLEGAETVMSVVDVKAKRNGFSTPPRRTPRTRQAEPPSPKQVHSKPAQDLGARSPKASGDEGKTVDDQLYGHVEEELRNGDLEHTSPAIDGGGNELGLTNDHEPDLTYTASKRLFNGIIEDSEPRPPLTPSHLRLETSPISPDGLLMSSPSTRPRRKKGYDKRYSPSKSRAPGPVMDILENQPSVSLGPRVLVTKTRRVRPIPLEDSSTAASAEGNANPSRYPSSLAQRIALFLPFSNSHVRKPDAPISKNLTRPNETNVIRISVTESTIPSAKSKDSTPQEQDITIASPQQLLVVRFHLTTDKKTKKITDLKMSSISPWAKSELGQWLQAEAVNLDRSTIEKTISRYWELSISRATCWYRCEQNLRHQPSNPKPNLDPLIQEQQEFIPPLPSENRASLLEHQPPNPSQTISKAQSPTFQPYLGQQSLFITQSPDIFLSIIWRVIISPAGAITSSLSAHAAFPDSWTQAPGGAALSKIGEAFELLIQEVGVFQAVRVLWGLAFGKEGTRAGKYK